jgi:hypothetical protein
MNKSAMSATLGVPHDAVQGYECEQPEGGQMNFQNYRLDIIAPIGLQSDISKVEVSDGTYQF